MQSTLEIILLFLGASVLAVMLFRRLLLPPILGYLLVGAIIGQHGFAWVKDSEAMHGFASFGVVFLMFSIGLEFSLPKLRALRTVVFGLGLAQVGLTIGAALCFAWVSSYILPEFWHISWQAALVLGGALSMSSTAVVSKMLVERLALDTQHGQQVMGILLFQDLAFVPLLIITPALAVHDEYLWQTLLYAAIKAIVILVILLFVGKILMRSWLKWVAVLRNQELFMLNLLFVTMGVAWITELAGLSAALGAFIAGMLISETEYKLQVEEDIKSFRDVFLGLFFITVGMLLNLSLIESYGLVILCLLLISLTFKGGLIFILAKFFGQSTGVAVRIALCLAQAGEFSFVLLTQMSELHLVSNLFSQIMLTTLVLSMVIAPFLIDQSEAIAMKISRTEWMQQSLAITKIASLAMDQKKHVLIAGFGRTGQSLATLLEEESIPYHALDLDPERVQIAQSGGAVVSYGDASRRESLIAAGVMRASVLVVTYLGTHSALKLLEHVKVLHPALPVIVRSYDESDIEKLREAGAAEVVPELIESSLMLASHALVLLGVPVRRVIHRVQRARDDRYEALRGYFHGLSDSVENDDHSQVRLQPIHITQDAKAMGSSIAALGLSQWEVEIVSMRRQMRRFAFTSETVLEAGDVLVLRGTSEALLLAEENLLG